MQTIEEMKSMVNEGLNSYLEEMHKYVEEYVDYIVGCNENGGNIFEIVEKAEKMTENFRLLQRTYEIRLSQMEMLEALEDK